MGLFCKVMDWVQRGQCSVVVNGKLCKASARWINLVDSALMAEAEALRDGVRLVPIGTREHIILETDSQVLVSLWRHRSKHRSEIGGILKDAAAIASAFTSFGVEFTRRTTKFVAPLCAKQAMVCRQDFIWLTPLGSCRPACNMIVLTLLK